jgi:hypothetical protein
MSLVLRLLPMYRIVSPTGVAVTDDLPVEKVEKLKKDGYFKVVSVYTGGGRCTACEG